MIIDVASLLTFSSLMVDVSLTISSTADNNVYIIVVNVMTIKTDMYYCKFLNICVIGIAYNNSVQ